MKYVAYYRVSTQKQGLGLDAQEDAVKRFISRDDVLLAEFSEKESGKNNNRPELAAAIELCKTEGATLLIAKLDRLSRDVKFLFTLKESGLQFRAIDAPELDTMTLSILAGFAQRERELISARTKAALAAKKARGESVGNHNAVITDEQRANSLQIRQQKARNNEANVRAWAVVRYCQDKPLKELADILNESKHLTSRGCKWHGNQVKALIQMYAA